LNREGIGKVLSTINRGLGESQLDAQQLEEIVDVWWPKLEEKLTKIAPPKEPAVARTTEDQLEEILQLTRENLRRENLRLEASMERDEKLDSLLGFLDQAGNAIGAMQAHAQKLQHSLGKRTDNIGPASVGPIDVQEAATAIASPALDGPIDASAVINIAETLRDLQERDKARTESMLASKSSGSLGGET
jgi:hypothetical protein